MLQVVISGRGDQTFSKGFFKWNSKISESFTIGSSQNEFYVDDAMHRGRSNYLRANISFTASFARWITFETSNEFSLSKTFTDGIANGNAKHTFTNSTSFVIWPCKQLSLMPTVMYYYNDYSASYRNNTFLNCNIEYSLGNAILSLKCVAICWIAEYFAAIMITESYSIQVNIVCVAVQSCLALDSA